MDNSILTSTKKLLGIAEEYTSFDTDIIIHINSALSVLTQVGVASSEDFYVKDEMDMWEDFTPFNSKIEMMKSYLYLKVKLLFDPPVNASVIESINKMISEFEWRIQIEVDKITQEEEIQNG